MRTELGGTAPVENEHIERTAEQRSESEAAPAASLDLGAILTHAHETAYRWTIHGDAMQWAANASCVLGFEQKAQPATGRAFSLLIDPEHAELRFRSISGERRGDETGYRIQYRMWPRGRRGKSPLWVEEQGRVVMGDDGAAEAAEGVLRVITERHDQEERLIYLSEHDQLTGQMNRGRLNQEVTSLIEDLRGTDRSGGFLLVAVNDLTLINDTYGFDIGDQVIAMVGQRLRSALRGRDCIGRHSSNKFGIVLHSCGREGLEAIAARLMRLVRDTMVETSAGAVPVTVSVGALKLPDHGVTVRDVMSRALETLERARRDRAATLAIYEACERRESERRRNIAIADEVIRALNDRRLMVALQPIVVSGAREPELYECLLRLKRPDNTILGAGEFVPVAEQFGLCRLLDHRVLELSIEMLRQDPSLKLSINVSASSATGHEWLSALEGFAGADRSLTERLTVEITETSAISDVDACIAFVSGLKALGCRVALDDFGAGHTSFRNLRMLGVDMVKIDGAFVKNLGRSAEDQVFVRTLIDLARSFGIETVGEWVTDGATADLLENAGISYMQGFHFGAPELAHASPARALAAASA